MGAGPFFLVYKQLSNFLPLIRFTWLQNNDFSVDIQTLLGAEVKNTSFLPLLSLKALQSVKSVNSNFLRATWTRKECVLQILRAFSNSSSFIHRPHMLRACHSHPHSSLLHWGNKCSNNSQNIHCGRLLKRARLPSHMKNACSGRCCFPVVLGRRNSLM